MRLTCPNCGAEYDVPDEVIPASGRDVQCSNCGDTWYQYHPDQLNEDGDYDPALAAALDAADDEDAWSGDDHAEDSEPEDYVDELSAAAEAGELDPLDDIDDFDPEDPEDDAGDIADVGTEDGMVDVDDAPATDEGTEARPQDSPAEGFAPLPDEPEAPAAPTRAVMPDVQSLDDIDWDSEDDDDEDEDDEESAGPPPGLQPRRKPLSDEVKSILQEEAQYEERARQSDPLESQPELGLDAPAAVPPPPPPRREVAAESRLARVRKAESPAPPVPASAAPGRSADPAQAAPRRDLLPDIEEINSSLRRRGEPGRKVDPRNSRQAAKDQRRGFRSGFMSILILMVVAAVIYLQAPKIGQAIPALNAVMTAYTETVDRGRVWLDEKAEILADKLDAATGDGQ